MNDREAEENTMPDRKDGFALLVDGFVKDLFATGMMLQRLEYEVYIASSAEDALPIIEHALPSLVITELSLPQMSGLELLVRIKHDARMKAVPVIIHSGVVDEEKQKLCRASGCATFLKKPADPELLFTAIQQATEHVPRHVIRLRTLLPVMVGGKGGAGGTEYVSQISENGIYVRTLNPRPLGAIVPVTIMIRSIPVRCKAQVLRSVTMRPGPFREPGMGMKFVEIAPTDRDLIRNVIKGQVMRDLLAR